MVEVHKKVFKSKLKVSRVRWNTVEVDIWYRLLRIVATGVGPRCPSFATFDYCKYCLVRSRCIKMYSSPS